MHLYFIRHGDPSYELDCLTEEGKRQADETSEALKSVPFEKLFCSELGRARETASYLAKKINMEAIPVHFTREDIAWKHFALYDENRKHDTWCFVIDKYVQRMIKLGNNPQWYEDELLKDTKMHEGVLEMNKAVDEWLLSLGIRHDRETKTYHKVEGVYTPAIVAMVAHGGAGMNFMSSILDLAYPYFSTHLAHLDLCGVTVIDINTDIHTPVILKFNEIYWKKKA